MRFWIAPQFLNIHGCSVHVRFVDINFYRAKRWICVQICINNLQPRQPRIWMTGRLWLCTKQLSESQKWASAAAAADRTRAAQNSDHKWWIPHTRPQIQLDARIKNSHASKLYKCTLWKPTRTSALNPRSGRICVENTEHATHCQMRMKISQHMHFTLFLYCVNTKIWMSWEKFWC